MKPRMVVTKHELPMQVSVGSPVVPRNCHQCPRPDWGHVTADTSVVHAVCGPEIIFPELSVKNNDLEREKAPACPPSSSTLFLFALYRREGGRDKDKLVATADENPWRDLPSPNFLSSPAILRHIPEFISISSCEHCTALSPFCSEHSRLIAAVDGRVVEGHPNSPLSSHL